MARELIQEIPAGAEERELVAFAPLDDPYSGHVEPGDDYDGVFTTTDTQEQFYTRANWAGPAGTDAREVQVAVAAEELAERQDARKFARHARATFRGLLPNSARRGNVAAVDVQPAVVGQVDDPTEVRTNQQAATKDIAGGDLTSSKIREPGNSEAQRLQDEAEQEYSGSGSSGSEGQAEGQAEEPTNYEQRSRGQNLADAQERGLDVRENASNANLAKALREDDEANRSS